MLRGRDNLQIQISVKVKPQWFQLIDFTRQRGAGRSRGITAAITNAGARLSVGSRKSVTRQLSPPAHRRKPTSHAQGRAGVVFGGQCRFMPSTRIGDECDIQRFNVRFGRARQKYAAIGRSRQQSTGNQATLASRGNGLLGRA